LTLDIAAGAHIPLSIAVAHIPLLGTAVAEKDHGSNIAGDIPDQTSWDIGIAHPVQHN
jgi:hypothetical protein